MFIPISLRTDYNLLKSMIKIPDLIEYLLNKKITVAGIVDDYLFSAIPFIKACEKNNIKPIIGLKIVVNEVTIFLYAKNYDGLKNLFKLNSLKQKDGIKVTDLKIYQSNLIIVLKAHSEFDVSDFNDVFYYGDDTINNKVYFKEWNCLSELDVTSFNTLNLIRDDNEVIECSVIDCKSDVSNEKFSNLIDIKLPINKRFIPHFKENVDSCKYLHDIALKGLNKRLNGVISEAYQTRLDYELKVINEMNYNDYFLIVYDYVLFAKKNDILVGPGRGSGAGSLVCYSLGITNVDPLKYNLYFERFLNKDRVTMPDIDIDFEYNKRDSVIDYVKNKYGFNKCSNIITYGTLKAKVCLRLVSKAHHVNDEDLSKLLSFIDPLKSLKDNLKNKELNDLISHNQLLKKVYNISLHLENLHHYPSTHAAGVVISSVNLDDIIPMYYDHDVINTGVTMEYLEDLGLLKMDFLALKNLTIINDIMSELKSNNVELDLDNIPLDDKLTLRMFNDADTLGIFQFESNGMINFLKKLKINNFKMIYDALALFRPGPINNLDNYINNGLNLTNINYLDLRLEPILKNTNGIIIYQEQIMEILVKLAGYSYSESDLVRRAMAKKKPEVLKLEEEKFVNGCKLNNISEEVSHKIFSFILRFADYGFNKSHSVSYALISYRIAYLKAHYPVIFIKYLLNNSIGSVNTTKDYISYAKFKNIPFIKPNINDSELTYTLLNNSIIMPLSLIKNMGSKVLNDIILERNNGKYSDIFDFSKRNLIILTPTNFSKLIKAGVFDTFGINRKTLINNIDIIINYAELANNLSASLIEKPLLTEEEEYGEDELINNDLEVYGFLLRNHQVTKYQSNDLVKIRDIKNYFNKVIKNVYLIDKIKVIKTKNNEDMLIITGSDETGNISIIGFKEIASNNKTLQEHDIICVLGEVSKRFNEYQIIIKKINKLN